LWHAAGVIGFRQCLREYTDEALFDGCLSDTCSDRGGVQAGASRRLEDGILAAEIGALGEGHPERGSDEGLEPALLLGDDARARFARR
jgi:hypothetical protein